MKMLLVSIASTLSLCWIYKWSLKQNAYELFYLGNKLNNILFLYKQ